MGTYYSEATKKELIAELTNEKEFNAKLLKKHLYGNQLWTAWERVGNDGKVYRYIHLDKLTKNRGYYGYKPMGEGVHPFYYDCPVSFFGIVPDDSEFSNLKWREEVRKRAALKQAIKTLSNGDFIKTHSDTFTYQKFYNVRGLTGTSHQDGRIYRIRIQSITGIEKKR